MDSIVFFALPKGDLSNLRQWVFLPHLILNFLFNQLLFLLLKVLFCLAGEGIYEEE